MYSIKSPKVNCSFIFIFILSLAACSGLNAQISVNLPAERSVFQRDNFNKGTITVSGNLGTNVDKIEARLIPVVFGQGTGTDWVTIDAQIDALSFTGKIEGAGGWYSLEIRSSRNSQVVDVATVQRVGIGEVFIIAGQSNAQGFGDNPNAFSATDDRVNGYSYFNNQFLNESVPLNTFVKVQGNVSIGPRGLGAWCWGEVGDKLVKKLNVPVMFFNTAYSGTTIENWVSSINGTPTFHKYLSTKFEGGTPYSNLRIILQNCASLYGVRAVLWHQGEADSNISESVYTEGLKTVIAETRKNTGKNINWMVARVSLDGNQVFSQVIRAQNAVINSTSLVFEGPATDNIQVPRYDGVHFINNSNGNGLSLLANAWDQTLNSFFFSSSTPFKGTELNEIKFKCDVNNMAALRLDKSYPSVRWELPNGSSVNAGTIQVNQGEYIAVARDQFGNYIFSNYLKVRDGYPKNSPQINPAVSLVACVGKTVELKATGGEQGLGLQWNTGETTPSVFASESKLYYANFKNSFDCISGNSNQVRPQFVNPPEKPNVEFINNKKAVCDGGKIDVRVTNQANYGIVWNTGETSNAVSYTKTPANGVFATLYSNYDCPSVPSATIRPVIQPLPNVPLIVQSGPYSLEAISNDGAVQFDWYLENNFFKREAKDLFIEKNGFYTVASFKTYPIEGGGTLECKSRLSSILSFARNTSATGIIVYPNPVVDGTFRITSDKALKNVVANLYTADGKMIYTTTIPDLLTPVPVKVSNHQGGRKYILSVNYDGIKKTYSLIFE